MRVLLVTNISGYSTGKGNAYNGGGWISSLCNEMKKQRDIILAQAYCTTKPPYKIEHDNITYYSFPPHYKSEHDKLEDLIRFADVTKDEKYWSYYIDNFKKIMADFKPDIIEVFGSELYRGLATIAAKELDIPCCLHIQGILSLYKNVLLPPEISKRSYMFSEGVTKAYSNFQHLVYWQRSCHREEAILKAVPHVIGRTSWDKKAMELLAPKAKYHYGGEILRPCFYEHSERTLPTKTIITTTSSNASYKGFDLILKIADVLKKHTNLDFEWNVYGNISPKFYERITGIWHSDVNIKLCGVATAEQLREALLNSTLYCHPSYIENSPNSVAEAQILGVPVVATNVGGTCSLVEHNKTGFLFPATDPYMAAYHIKELAEDNLQNIRIGNNARNIGITRHNPKAIIDDLISTYKEIINS